MYRLENFFLFVLHYKMVFITTDNYADAGVHTITVKNKE